LRFNKTLNKILEEKRPNDPVILGCYKNSMSSNVKFAIRASQIETLDEAMIKAIKMEEIMIETGVDPDIILGRVQRQMDSLNIVDQGRKPSKNFLIINGLYNVQEITQTNTESPPQEMRHSSSPLSNL
jgi:hypothetical protein